MKSFWTTFYRFKIHHILLWAAYFAFWMLYYAKYYPSLYSLTFTISIYFIFNSVPFYITGYYLFPKYLYQRKYLAFTLLFLAVITVSSIGLTIVLYALFNKYVPEVSGNIVGVFQIAMLSVSTMVAGLGAVKIVIDKIRSDKESQHIEKQRLESELQYLKAQVNPHFLFNAINSVYFLIKKNPDVAAETLIKLSDLLRFQLYDCLDDKIPIEKEMEYLKNFVALEKIRKGEKIKVELTIGEGMSGFMIAPFMLIPFLENAFKHVSTSSDRENKIGITFDRVHSQFTATFFNTSDNLKRNEVGGIGLKNVKRRLELLYPHRHELVIKEENNTYSVNLSMSIE
jgi:two-component system, LytTR family, sensor kinase